MPKKFDGSPPGPPGRPTSTGTTSTRRRNPYYDITQAYAEEIDRGDRADRRRVRTTDLASNRTPVPRGNIPWTIVGRCGKCRGPIVATRTGADYVEQTEHRPGCPDALPGV